MTVQEQAPVTGVGAPGRAQIDARTLRTDRWWLAPLVTAVGLLAWIAYATVRVFMQKYYFDQGAGHSYLTPFYSPCISNGCVPDSSHFGRILPNVWFIPYAAFTLPFLLLFRFTCYYYRKAYYRSFYFSPPGCAVAEPHAKYNGETKIMIFQNAHRYFFYIAFIISAINTWDVLASFHGKDGFGFGFGNLVLIVNIVMLWLYTLSCHSCRNAIGGRLKHFSKHPVRYRMWTWVSRINTKHMNFAWITLATLAITDFYVMAVSAGWFADPRFIN
jgi:hypothetical protein